MAGWHSTYYIRFGMFWLSFRIESQSTGTLLNSLPRGERPMCDVVMGGTLAAVGLRPSGTPSGGSE